MVQYGTRSGGIRRGLLALTFAAGLVLTGCSGSGSDSPTSAKDESRGGNGSGGAPLPGVPQQSGGPAEGEQREKSDGSKDFAPPPDYLSTFALDVDTASYGFARRTLAEGRLPDPATVRPEEFVNSFRQDYPRPEGNGFSVTMDGAGTPRGDDGWSLLRVGLATKAAESQGERPPAALTFVIDISGSMAEPGRLDLVKQSLDLMTDQLRGDDSIAIVTFSDEAEEVLPMTRLGDNRGRIHDVIGRLQPTQSTNLDAGVRTGYDTAVEGRRRGATNRVVLLSDALANTGSTSADEILERISNARKEHGITLFGVGVGSEYGDALMEQLADKGDGHTTYVSDIKEARKVFCQELPAHIELRARDAKAQVAFDPQTVQEFKLIGYDNRQVADEDFRNDQVDGGEVGPGHTVTALYAVRLKGNGGGHVATASVRWLDPNTRTPHETSRQIETGGLEGSLWGGADKRFQVAAVAAYFADALRVEAPYSPCESGTRCAEPEPAGDTTTYSATPYDESAGRRYSSLPGTIALPELAAKARQLADGSEDEAIQQLATAVQQASDLRGDRY
ncbi:von Willebrand factor type A domain-containing protein [Streptomyces sp. T-3]|nr:von Willebrand factor type A domain-containing protein [Streptomyces sp. T-3]